MLLYQLMTLLCLVPPLMGGAPSNLVRNPSLEMDRDGDGCPDGWRFSGDSRLVSQRLTREAGRDGKHCGRLTCSRFREGTPAAHAMICQMGVPVERGRTYRVRLWARAEGIAGDVVSIALSDTSIWANCGLDSAFSPGPDWEQFEFLFPATRSVSDRSRFQIWFKSTGTLWLDDVEFVEAGPDAYRPGRIISPDDAPGGPGNLIPNASFECGTSGWGSAEWDRAAHWGGPMNRLFGEVDVGEAVHGRCSLRIELTPQNQPVSYFDYFDLHRMPVRAPLAASVGFLPVEPGQEHTLSVFLRASGDDVPALLAVRQFRGRSFERGVRLTRRWKRYRLTFRPTSRWCYVLAGPDLRRGEDSPSSATVWVDAVQLERGEAPSEFRPRRGMELGISTKKPGNVFLQGEPVVLEIFVSSDGEEERVAPVELLLTDFFDEPLWKKTLEVRLPPGGSGVEKVILPASGDGSARGFLRLRARLQAGSVKREETMRLAVIPSPREGDARFGMNHAYPWPHLLELSRMAGLRWVRDWSLKWKDVEPEKGTFTFTETDRQIDRPLKQGLGVLCMLPFPSSPWSSSAPESEKQAAGYREQRAILSRAPRDLGEFETYVERTVAHYRDRVNWWQVFNEPLFTEYALPRKYGYDGRTYARYTRAFARAARRAHPRCKILAGIGYLQEGQILEDFRLFFQNGGLEVIDAVDIHQYPRLRPPEFIEGLLDQLNRLMDEQGGRKPIWLTEYGYYADDEPWSVPMPHQDFNIPLKSEALQAAYAVRWAVLCFAGGVEKIFYHAGTCAGINGDSLQGVFFEYGGEPHKIYAAQAVLSDLFSPTCKFVQRIGKDRERGVRAYLFRDGARLIAPVWAPRGSRPGEWKLRLSGLQLMDIAGRRMSGRSFVPGRVPVYILGEGMDAPVLERGIE